MSLALGPMICPTCGQRYEAGAFCATDGTPLQRAGGASAEGQVLAERYRLTHLLGQGGMGQVYAAEHLHIAKKFAIKLLRPEILSSPEAVVRFRQEAWAASSIGHENIIEIEDFATLPDGRVYLAMELLDGESLAERMKRAPIPLAEGLDLSRQVCRGLHAAHEKGIVHRDLKPENLFLVARTPPLVKILDFGIAKVFGGTEPSVQTRTGQIVGTPQYMSPEQACGKAAGPATDVYSLGVILYEVVSGKVPFAGDSALEVLTQHLTKEPSAPSLASPERRIAPELDRLVLAMMAKDPSQRPSIVQVAEVLDAVAHGTPAPALPARASGRRSAAAMGAVAPVGAAASAQIPAVPAAASAQISAVPGAASAQISAVPGAASAQISAVPGAASAQISAVPGAGAQPGSRRGVWIAVAALALAGLGAGIFALVRNPSPSSAPGGATSPSAGAANSQSTGTANLPPTAALAANQPEARAGAQAATTTVVVDSIPVGAQILRDGKPIGTTPEALTVKAGEPERVILHKEGFADRPVVVDPAQGDKLVVKLQRAEAHASREAAHGSHEAAHASREPAHASRETAREAARETARETAREPEPPPAPPAEKPRVEHAHDPLTQRIDAEVHTVAPGSRRVATFQGSGPRTDWFVQLDGNRCYTFAGTVEAGGLYLYLWGPGGRRLVDHRSRTQTGSMYYCTAFPGSYHLQGKVAGGGGGYKVGVYTR